MSFQYQEFDKWKQPESNSDGYMKGDRVVYDGCVWASTMNFNVWTPGVYGWKVVSVV